MSPARSVTSSTGSPGSPSSAVYFWLLQRQLEDGRIDEPALLARDLEAEDVVRVVVDLEPLGRGRRVVRVRLRRVAELRSRSRQKRASGG